MVHWLHVLTDYSILVYIRCRNSGREPERWEGKSLGLPHLCSNQFYAPPPSLSHLNRFQFHSSLYQQLLPLTQLVALTIPTAHSSKDLIMTFDLMRSVLEQRALPDGVSRGACLTLQSRIRMLQALLIHHFTLLKMLGTVVSKPTVLLDTIAPQSLAVLKAWPEEDTLKYSLERWVW